MGCILGLEHLTSMKCLKMLVIMVGIVMAGAAEASFSFQGILFQILSILFESARIILIQFLISGTGLHMDPLVSLYYFAPVCAFTSFMLSYLLGWSSFEWTHAVEVGFWMLLLNAVIAFLLNVSSVLLVRFHMFVSHTMMIVTNLDTDWQDIWSRSRSNGDIQEHTPSCGCRIDMGHAD